MSDIDNNNPYAPPPAGGGSGSGGGASGGGAAGGGAAGGASGGTPANPYAAPRANVAQEPSPALMGGLIENGQSVPGSRGAGWVADGWRIFMQAPGMWIGLIVVYVLLTIVVSIVPFLGTIAVYLLWPVMTAGLLLGCRALDEGEPLEMNHLFAGFKENVGSLILIGLLYMVAMVVIFIGIFAVAMVAGFASMAAFRGSGSADPAAFGLIAVFVLLGIGLTIPVAMAIWYAPALVVFHEQDPMSAMKQSFRGCLKNLLPWLLWGVIYFFLAILATLPVMLGWLVLGPMMVGSLYQSYKDVFVDPSTPA